MKKLLLLSFLFILSGCMYKNQFHTNENRPEKTLFKEETIKSKALAQIDGLINTIKPIMMGSLKSDPTGASGIDMCSATAMEITKNYNKGLIKGIKVRRTALRYRNPLNKPDTLDKKVMNIMIASKNMSPIMVETKSSYRVYKPLQTMQPCLACHGDLKTMSPATVTKIKKHYPKDLANGFKLGDFRGVVVAEIKK